MKKIAILYPAHYEQMTGGAEIQVKYFCDACIHNGYEVHFIFEDNGVTVKNSSVHNASIKKNIVC